MIWPILLGFENDNSVFVDKPFDLDADFSWAIAVV